MQPLLFYQLRALLASQGLTLQKRAIGSPKRKSKGVVYLIRIRVPKKRP